MPAAPMAAPMLSDARGRRNLECTGYVEAAGAGSHPVSPPIVPIPPLPLSPNCLDRVIDHMQPRSRNSPPFTSHSASNVSLGISERLSPNQTQQAGDRL